MRSFGRQVRDWVDKADRKQKDTTRDIGVALFDAFSDNTPVRTGFLRGSWYAAYSGYKNNDGDYDPTGVTTKEEARDVLRKFEDQKQFWIMNSAYYARFVEFGTSKMEARLYATTVARRARTIANGAINV